MGLDVSHNAFSGGYIRFNQFRQTLAWCNGGSFSPHWKRNFDGSITRYHDNSPVELNDCERDKFYYNSTPKGGLFCLLSHSDCDGEITWKMCRNVADDLKDLIPKMNLFYRKDIEMPTLLKFIAGCEKAYELKEDLLFR